MALLIAEFSTNMAYDLRMYTMRAMLCFSLVVVVTVAFVYIRIVYALVRRNQNLQSLSQKSHTHHRSIVITCCLGFGFAFLPRIIIGLFIPTKLHECMAHIFVFLVSNSIEAAVIILKGVAEKRKRQSKNSSTWISKTKSEWHI